MNAQFAFWLLAAPAAIYLSTASGHAQQSQADLSAAGATLSQAQFVAEPATPAALAARASGVASVLTGAEAPAVAPETVSKAMSAPGRADFLIESAGRVHILIDSAQSELLAVNGVVADDFASEADVGVEKARAVFDDAMKGLASRKLVDYEGLELGKARTGRIMQAETPLGGTPTPRVKEYFFEVPRTLGGIEVFGASVTVSVHRSGRIASIRILGPNASRAKETIRRAISASALEERVRRDNPGGQVTPLGLQYPWRAATGNAAVKPREAFRVAPVTTVEGRTINGRVHYVFYAVDNSRDAPIVWPRPNPNATGDRRK